MNKFFEVTVAIEIAILKNGNPKLKKEVYLIDALSVTEAEAKLVKDFLSSSQNIDYTVKSVKESRIYRVID